MMRRTWLQRLPLLAAAFAPLLGPTENPEPDCAVPLLAGPNWGGDKVEGVCACEAPAPPKESAAKSITLRVSNE